jgi:hypothetical protein
MRFLHPDTGRLHGLGWADADIIDAIFHGADMVRRGLMSKAFQMDRDSSRGPG